MLSWAIYVAAGVSAAHSVAPFTSQALVSDQGFQHIIRVLNTNVDGRQKVMFAITAIKGIGRRLSNVACKKAEVDLAKRAGELSASELESLMVVVSNPRQFRVPDWFLNRKKDIKDGRFTQASGRLCEAAGVARNDSVGYQLDENAVFAIENVLLSLC